MIKTDCVDRIHQVDLLSVIGEYVQLRKQGGNHIGCCPFHEEKTGSFYVSPGKNIYKCFGCGEGGNTPVQFLMDYKQLTYPEALEEVARLGRIVVEYERGDREEVRAYNKELKDKTTALRELMQQVVEVYQPGSFKLEPQEWVDCFGKQYTFETIAKWGLGYAPADNYIKKIAPVLGWQEQLLLDIGVLKSSDKGGHYDFYRDRLLFPIRNHQGIAVAIAGRKPKDDTNHANPKYINSPETLLYKKEEVLYGLYENKTGIHKAGFAYLTEGYTDVITLDAYRYANAVASCGTALTFKQVQLLRRYTEQVTVLRDGDEAGLKAARRDVELLIKGGVVAKVCIMQDGEDPDSFLRKHNKAGFDFYLEQHTQDALIWRIMLEWDKEDAFKKEQAFKKAGELLAHLDSNTLRDNYITELTSRKRMGPVKKILADSIEQYKEKNLKKADSGLSEQQEEDVIEFGMYEENNRYFLTSFVGGASVQISNFIVRPVMLVISANGSQRLVEIINEYKKSFIINVESQSFTGLNEFKKVVEGYGNYRFIGKPEHFEKVKAKVYRDSRDCFPINTMGFHRDGFYAWGNGISVKGKFVGIDEYGIVEHDKTLYFLPAFSKVQDNFKGDDSDESFEFEKKFSYYPDPACISTTEWGRLMVEVHGMNGAAGMMFFIASLFRDIIFGKLSFFPHLNLFGPPGAGKSFMARSVMAMFGREIDQDPFNLASGTPVAFKRRLAQVSNGIVWFDEYSNQVDFRRVEALKGAYDGAGHERGVSDNSSNRTKTTKVKAALIVSGQQQPTQDVALFKRCVSINFASASNSLEKQLLAKQLKDIEKSGQLTQITQYLLSYRDKVHETFSEQFDKWSQKLFKALEEDGYAVEDRLVKNHCVLLAIYEALKEDVEFGFTSADLLEYIYHNIITQSDAIYNEDEMSVFWRIVEFLAVSNQITHGEDIVIEECVDVTVQNELDRKDRKDSKEIRFKEKTNLVFIRFAKLHPLYMERHQRQRNKLGLDLDALQYYLRQSTAYIGQKRAKKFNDKALSCYVFDLSKLPVELPLTIQVQTN